MAKSNTLPKNQFLVLHWIAEHGPATEYDLLKYLNLNSFVAHQTPTVLMKKGLLKAELKGKARTGKTIKLYHLTFRGLLKYFASAREFDFRNPETRNNLKKAIIQAHQFYPDEKIFSEWDSIEEWLSTQGYQILCWAALETERRPPVVPIGYSRDDWLPFTHEQIPRKISEIFEVLGPTEEEETLWKFAFENAFVEPFVDPILVNKLRKDFEMEKISPLPNENLHVFFQEILESKIREAYSEIERDTVTKKAFETLFKGR